MGSLYNGPLVLTRYNGICLNFRLEAHSKGPWFDIKAPRFWKLPNDLVCIWGFIRRPLTGSSGSRSVMHIPFSETSATWMPNIQVRQRPR